MHALLQRFDILCVLRDEADAVADHKLATFVVESHARSHPKATEALRKQHDDANRDVAGDKKKAALAAAAARAGDDPGSWDYDTIAAKVNYLFPVRADANLIDQELLKKYIAHARALVRPSLAGIDEEKVAQFYKELRKEAEYATGVPIAVRHIESIMRMAEAAARMRLSLQVRPTRQSYLFS
jgi:DNA replication licensing factor MCM2